VKSHPRRGRDKIPENRNIKITHLNEQESAPSPLRRAGVGRNKRILNLKYNIYEKNYKKRSMHIATTRQHIGLFARSPRG
jgi:hypothetical protein